MDIIRAVDLDVGYESETVLRGLNFSLLPGRITVIVGESGAGKSTLLKALIGLSPPLSGDVYWGEERIDYESERSLAALYRRIGVLYQNSALLNSLTLYENIALPIRIHRPETPRKDEEDRVHEVLGMVGLVGADHKYPFELSGGMRKRAALARSMVLKPEIVFCDEPSAGLDPLTASGLDDLLRALQTSRGMTVVAVTHELRSICRIADRVLLLHGDGIRFDGTLPEMEKSADEYLRSFFLRT
ncbi:MAG: ATP-binding cassette domain-containing protein [Candidatus Aminicenantes bacterium]|nr:ATP-binding cassette domain-containing protein [Candidatus Aminicenantes bacterium]